MSLCLQSQYVSPFPVHTCPKVQVAFQHIDDGLFEPDRLQHLGDAATRQRSQSLNTAHKFRREEGVDLVDRSQIE